MKASIITGHPDWEEGLNPTTEGMWKERLSRIPQITSYSLHNVYGHTIEELEEFVQDADIVIGWPIGPSLSEAFMDRHPNLKYIATMSMGFGQFDRELFRKRNVTLTNTVYGANTIAQFAMALLLDICHDITANANYIKQADWSLMGHNPSHALTEQIELYGKTMGIIGLGNIGHWVAKMAAGFGMKVIAFDKYPKSGPEYDWIEYVELDELLCRSDVISLNCTLNPSTENLINRETLEKMKDGVILLNVARAGLINEEDLIEYLQNGKVKAAGLDATSFDEGCRHIALMDLPNVRVTGHIAWFPMDARYRDIQIAADNLEAWLRGEPKSVIN